MRYLTIEQVCRAANGKLLQGTGTARALAVCTDSRELKPCELFVALSGPNFDGHDFVPEALALGAAGAVVSRSYNGHLTEPHRHTHGALIAVDDPLKALGDIARSYRSSMSVQVVGITGSNGKTTAKEMLHHVLSGQMECVCTPGNFNNAVGVPKSLFQIEPQHDAAVIEMGTSAPGEIEYLAGIARPNVAVITNISAAHTEGFSNVKGVAREKAAIFQSLPADGMAVFNQDDYWCREIEKTWDGPRLHFGIDTQAEVVATDVSADATGISFSCAGLKILVPVLGEHNVYNALAAAAAARALGVSWQTIRDRLRTFRPVAMRMERTCVGGVMVINDAYNANPESMLAALRTLGALPAGRRRILVMGDMKELGEISARCHRDIGQKLAESGIDVVWTVGSQALAAGAVAAENGMGKGQLFSSPDARHAAKGLPDFVKPGDVVMVKGSRSVGLEEVVQAINAALAARDAMALRELPGSAGESVGMIPTKDHATRDRTHGSIRETTHGRFERP